MKKTSIEFTTGFNLVLNSHWSSVSVVQGYHELYELQRSRLEAQLLQVTEQRDTWKDLTLGLALKVCANLSLTQLHPQLYVRYVPKIHSLLLWYYCAALCKNACFANESMKRLVFLDDWHEKAAALHPTASQWAGLVKNCWALQHLPIVQGSHIFPFLYVFFFKFLVIFLWHSFCWMAIICLPFVCSRTESI